ncbi:YceI family protein [Psychroflexus sp. CAK57W]|uniref:YceI family protein n=1 Tax=Psychroflexus curvus TaxID=2873595 RepID=UPI001CC954E8|nr:YceI family protein [Psychroflexus curvus]MBZ9628097.1 YceI family protein [Psychroflexus curvus]MBZ9787796.1 YceI family protein [Psychroflexus curvus]
MKKNVINSMLVLSLIALALSCKSDKKTETSDEKKTAETSEMATTYKVDVDQSKIKWIGSKPAGEHNGTVSLSEGTLTANGDELVGGTIVIDMTSVDVLDLEGQDKKDLENHLMGYSNGKEDHFFNATKYPEANFEITGVNTVENQTMLSGNLTLKDTTKNITFPVQVSMNEADDSLVLLSDDIILDRTEWGIKFMSKSFIENLGDNFVSDEMKIAFDLTAFEAE